MVREMTMALRISLCILCQLWLCFSTLSQGGAEEKVPSFPPLRPGKLRLVQAAMCEGIKDFLPQNQAIFFSVSIGKTFCFTFFDPVPEETSIHHNWYYKDKLVTSRKLTLKPPKWSTFSSIQLREADIGPWRVEIKNQAGAPLSVLRFSIGD
jgi:hypothetical protein